MNEGADSDDVLEFWPAEHHVDAAAAAAAAVVVAGASAGGGPRSVPPSGGGPLGHAAEPAPHLAAAAAADGRRGRPANPRSSPGVPAAHDQRNKRKGRPGSDHPGRHTPQQAPVLLPAHYVEFVPAARGGGAVNTGGSMLSFGSHGGGSPTLSLGAEFLLAEEDGFKEQRTAERPFEDALAEVGEGGDSLAAAAAPDPGKTLCVNFKAALARASREVGPARAQTIHAEALAVQKAVARAAVATKQVLKLLAARAAAAKLAQEASREQVARAANLPGLHAKAAEAGTEAETTVARLQAAWEASWARLQKQGSVLVDTLLQTSEGGEASPALQKARVVFREATAASPQPPAGKQQTATWPLAALLHVRTHATEAAKIWRQVTKDIAAARASGAGADPDKTLRNEAHLAARAARLAEVAKREGDRYAAGDKDTSVDLDALEKTAAAAKEAAVAAAAAAAAYRPKAAAARLVRAAAAAAADIGRFTAEIKAQLQPLLSRDMRTAQAATSALVQARLKEEAAKRVVLLLEQQAGGKYERARLEATREAARAVRGIWTATLKPVLEEATKTLYGLAPPFSSAPDAAVVEAVDAAITSARACVASYQTRALARLAASWV